MKRLIARMIVVTAIVAILVGAFACASSEEASVPRPAPAPAPAPAPMPSPAPPSSGIGSVFGGKETPAPVIVNQAPPPVIAIPPAGGSGSGSVGETWATERMIVRTGEISLVVVDVAVSIDRIAGLADSYQGYVVSSNSWRDGDRLAGQIAIRVPAERFDDAIRSLRQMAVEVTQESTSSKDVTEEYVDLSARLDNLEATRVQLEKLLEKTEEKVTDILEVQRELSRVTGEIEQTKGRMQYLEQTSSTSLISIQLQQAALDVTFTAGNRRVKEG